MLYAKNATSYKIDQALKFHVSENTENSYDEEQSLQILWILIDDTHLETKQSER